MPQVDDHWVMDEYTQTMVCNKLRDLGLEAGEEYLIELINWAVNREVYNAINYAIDN